jgi:hypothetical protein
MVNTKSGSGVDQPAAPRRRARNNTNPNPPPSQPHQTPPAGMEQFLAAQTQLLTNMANTITNMQAQMNQAPPPPPPARDRHREFISHKPPTFSHSLDPLQADDWIKTVEKMLNLAQCTDREKVLYASGRLEGTAADWWDAYTAAHDNPNTISWQEFRSKFREQHIPKGLMKLKKQEFVALKQGAMSVSKYRDKFIQLSRYAPADVADDEEKQDHFREGLIGPIKYQLMVHTFDSFQKMVDKAIMVEHARKEMGEQKRKYESPTQFSSNARPRFNTPQGTPFRSGGQNVNFRQSQYQRFNQQGQQQQQAQHASQSVQRSNFQQNRQGTPTGTPMRNNATAPAGGNTCYRCGEVGHYANRCPKGNG